MFRGSGFGLATQAASTRAAEALYFGARDSGVGGWTGRMSASVISGKNDSESAA